jgi:hypothetical protein
MRVRVNFTISGTDGDSVLSFANTVGQPVDKIAKVAFIQYINKVLKKAEELEAAASKETPSGDGNTVHAP